MDALSRSINPLKERECLATGKPVVATALPEIERLDGVLAARTADEFLAAVDSLLARDAAPAPGQAARALAGASWEERAAELAGHLRAIFDAVVPARFSVVIPLFALAAAGFLWSDGVPAQPFGSLSIEDRWLEQADRAARAANDEARRQEAARRQRAVETRMREELERSQDRRKAEARRKDEAEAQQQRIDQKRLAREQQRLQIEQRRLAWEKRKLELQTRERGQSRLVQRMARQNEDLAEQQRLEAQVRQGSARQRVQNAQRLESAPKAKTGAADAAPQRGPGG
jgi:hypothetical protein